MKPVMAAGLTPWSTSSSRTGSNETAKLNAGKGFFAAKPILPVEQIRDISLSPFRGSTIIGTPIAMERKVALSDLQLFVSFLGHAERPQLAP
jgi:hypothetical protein